MHNFKWHHTYLWKILLLNATLAFVKNRRSVLSKMPFRIIHFLQTSENHQKYSSTEQYTPEKVGMFCYVQICFCTNQTVWRCNTIATDLNKKLGRLEEKIQVPFKNWRIWPSFLLYTFLIQDFRFCAFRVHSQSCAKKSVAHKTFSSLTLSNSFVRTGASQTFDHYLGNNPFYSRRWQQRLQDNTEA